MMEEMIDDTPVHSSINGLWHVRKETPRFNLYSLVI